jgi:hypothetical protein
MDSVRPDIGLSYYKGEHDEILSHASEEQTHILDLSNFEGDVDVLLPGEYALSQGWCSLSSLHVLSTSAIENVKSIVTLCHHSPNRDPPCIQLLVCRLDRPQNQGAGLVVSCQRDGSECVPCKTELAARASW